MEQAAKPVSEYSAASQAALQWWEGVLERSQSPLMDEMTVQWLIGVGHEGNERKSFVALLTRAWLGGVLPNRWGQGRMEYQNHFKRRRDAYSEAVAKYGEKDVNLGKVKW